MRYWLGKILESDGDLAFDWLRIRLQEGSDRFFLAEEGPFSKATAPLNEQQRIMLLSALVGHQLPRPLVSMLINKSCRVYSELLRNKELSRFHFEPLAGIPEKEWPDLAFVALEHGYDAQKIAQAAFHVVGISVVWGAESMRLSKWDEAFAKLEEDSRAEIREVARHGRQIAQAQIQRAKEQEHQEEVHGS